MSLNINGTQFVSATHFKVFKRKNDLLISNKFEQLLLNYANILPEQISQIQSIHRFIVSNKRESLKSQERYDMKAIIQYTQMSEYSQEPQNYSYISEIERVNECIRCTKHLNTTEFLINIVTSSQSNESESNSQITQECLVCYLESRTRLERLINKDFNRLVEEMTKQSYVNSIDFEDIVINKDEEQEECENNINIRVQQLAFDVFCKVECSFEKEEEEEECASLISVQNTQLQSKRENEKRQAEETSMKEANQTSCVKEGSFFYLDKTNEIVSQVSSFVKMNTMRLRKQLLNVHPIEKRNLKEIKSRVMDEFQEIIYEQIKSFTKKYSWCQLKMLSDEEFEQTVDQDLIVVSEIQQINLNELDLLKKLLKMHLKECMVLVVSMQEGQQQIRIRDIKQLFVLIRLLEKLHRQEISIRPREDKEEQNVKPTIEMESSKQEEIIKQDILCEMNSLSVKEEENSFISFIEQVEEKVTSRLRNGQFLVKEEDVLEFRFDAMSYQSERRIPKMDIWNQICSISLLGGFLNELYLSGKMIEYLLFKCMNLKQFSLKYGVSAILISMNVEMLKKLFEGISKCSNLTSIDLDFERVDFLESADVIKISQNAVNNSNASELRTFKCRFGTFSDRQANNQIEQLIVEFISMHHSHIEEFLLTTVWEIFDIERMSRGLLKCEKLQRIHLRVPGFEEKPQIAVKWIGDIVSDCECLKSFVIGEESDMKQDVEGNNQVRLISPNGSLAEVNEKSRINRRIEECFSKLQSVSTLFIDEVDYESSKLLSARDYSQITSFSVKIADKLRWMDRPIVATNRDWIGQQIRQTRMLESLQIEVSIDLRDVWWRRIQDPISDCRNLVRLCLKLVDRQFESNTMQCIPSDQRKEINVKKLEYLEIHFKFQVIFDDIIWVSNMIQSSAHNLKTIHLEFVFNDSNQIFNIESTELLFLSIAKCTQISCLKLRIWFYYFDHETEQFIWMIENSIPKLENLTSFDFFLPNGGIYKEKDLKDFEKIIAKCPKLISLKLKFPPFWYKKTLEKLANRIGKKHLRLISISSYY